MVSFCGEETCYAVGIQKDILLYAKGVMNMYTVTLSAVGNPDYNENPNSNIVNGCEVPNVKIANADNLNVCRNLVEMYIKNYGLGSGNFTGGRVYKDGKYIGRFSYNLRFWEKDSKYGAE